MCIVIQNMGGDTEGVRSYEVRINNDVITTFDHDRTKGLAACLQEAADAVRDQENLECYAIMCKLQAIMDY